MVALFKRELVDRIEVQLDRFEPKLRAAFLQVVAGIRDERSLRELSRLLEAGRIDEALAAVEAHAAILADAATLAYIETARRSAAFITTSVGPATFDVTNTRAVREMQQNRLRIIREFSQEQRAATQEALVDGIRRGLNPREQARAFRASIGLTSKQQQAVNNYRRLLMEDPAEALTRQLRDRRFDPTVARAIRDAEPLTPAQIDRMVERYRQRYLKYRAEMIARTEALRAVHMGAERMYQQAIDGRILDPGTLVGDWIAAMDSRTRDSHASMHRQRRPFGEPFISGNGYLLRYPGDPAAPASETIHCRCSLARRIIRLPASVAV